MNWNGRIFFLSLLTLASSMNVIVQFNKENIGITTAFIIIASTLITLFYAVKEEQA